MELLGQTLRVVDAGGDDVALVGDVGLPAVAARAKRICADHNALAGLNPDAVAGLVAALETTLFNVESLCASNPGAFTAWRDTVRAALAALKGGAK